MNVVTLIFWLSAGVLIYVFIGFPLILILRGLLLPRPYKQDDITPSVSLIIAAYNEAGVIEEKLKNSLALDYPPDRLEIIVASDGSTDGTDGLSNATQSAASGCWRCRVGGRFRLSTRLPARQRGKFSSFLMLTACTRPMRCAPSYVHLPTRR